MKRILVYVICCALVIVPLTLTVGIPNARADTYNGVCQECEDPGGFDLLLYLWDIFIGKQSTFSGP